MNISVQNARIEYALQNIVVTGGVLYHLQNCNTHLPEYVFITLITFRHGSFGFP